MKILEFLEQSNMKRGQLAQLLGVSYNHISLIILGKKIPSRKLAEKIEFVTKGLVKKEGLLFPTE